MINVIIRSLLFVLLSVVETLTLFAQTNTPTPFSFTNVTPTPTMAPTPITVLPNNDVLGNPDQVFIHGFGNIRAFDLTIDESQLFTTSYGGDIKVFDLESGELIRIYPTFPLLVNESVKNNANAYVYLLDSDRLFVTGAYNKALVWDTASGEVIHEFTHSLQNMSAQDGGPLVSTGAYDSTAKIWNAISGELVNTIQIEGLNGARDVHNTAISPDGTKVLVAHNSGMTYLYSIKTGEELFSTNLDNPVSFSHDGTMFFVGNELYSTETFVLLYTFPIEGRYIRGSFSYDQTLVLFVDSQSGQAQVYDLTSKALVWELENSIPQMFGCAFLKDGKRFLISGRYQELAYVRLFTLPETLVPIDPQPSITPVPNTPFPTSVTNQNISPTPGQNAGGGVVVTPTPIVTSIFDWFIWD